MDGEEALISTTNLENGTQINVFKWPQGNRHEVEYTNGAVATYKQGVAYWYYQRTNQSGRTQFYSSAGLLWELYKDEELEYQNQIKITNQACNAILLAQATALTLPFSSLNLTSDALLIKRGISGGADLLFQIADDDEKGINKTSILSNIFIGNPLTSGTFGVVFDSRQTENAITSDGDRTTTNIIKDAVISSIGNFVGDKWSRGITKGWEKTGFCKSTKEFIENAGHTLGEMIGNTTSSAIQEKLKNK